MSGGGGELHADAGAGDPRDPRAFAAELDYWKALMDDLLAVNDAIGEAADQPVTILTCLLPVAIHTQGDTISGPMLERAGEAAGAVMRQLAAMQLALDRIIGLARGRLAQLQAEGERIRGEAD